MRAARERGRLDFANLACWNVLARIAARGHRRIVTAIVQPASAFDSLGGQVRAQHVAC